MFVLKNGHAPELSGENSHAKLSHLKQLMKKYSSSDVSTISLTYERHLQWSTEKPKGSLTLRNCSNQQERRRDKRLRTQSTFRQSLMASVGESQVIEKTQVCRSRSLLVIEGCYRNVMLL